MVKLALHWKIVIGMVLGIFFGLIMLQLESGKEFVQDWIEPIGSIFVRMLKLIAVPLILASLIKGISDLKDISKFKSMGIKTILVYMTTTVFAISIGLGMVNLIKPGEGVSSETVAKLKQTYASNEKIQERISEASKQQERGPLQFVVDMVPDNAIAAMSNNKSMLQVIFFTIFLGISMLLVPEKQVRPLKKFFDALNYVILKMVDLIMLFAPVAVLSLLATVIVTTNDTSVLFALLRYVGVVVVGLLLLLVFYLIVVGMYTKKAPLWFLKQIAPAQLLAFSTSSSAATLPVTMERVEEHIGVDKEVSSFVLPVGATINMDGTSLYQAVASVFIMQVLWPEGLIFSNQLVIILTALLASIGSAAVPGAGMVMLVIVLDAVGFPKELLPIGLALIFAVDRPLDMLRTTINVTGDACVSMVIAKSEGKLGSPHVQNWDDDYPQKTKL
tara:strand:- start:7765 stop:9099 length:1335 start_codon:yes stop_codon:yes gene_type:complete